MVAKFLWWFVLSVLTISVIFTSGVLNPSLANAATFYVATNGSDANPGTQQQPFRTIIKGVSKLVAGDTLYVRQGIYQEALAYNTVVASGASWSAAVTIASYPGETATMKPSSGCSNVVDFGKSQRYIIFDRIVFDAANCGSAGNGVYLGKGVTYIKFANGEIQNAPRQGGLVTGSYNQFIKMSIHDNGRGVRLDHGLYISGNSNLVEGSRVYRNAAYGVHVFNGYSGQTANNNIVRNNQVYDNARLGGTSPAGILIGSGNGNSAYNNLVWGNLYGIVVNYKSASGSQVYHNTVYGNAHYGIVIGAGCVNTAVKNNIIYQNKTAIRNDGSGTSLANNLTTDPKFVDVSARNFRLQSGSPALNTGVTLSVVPNDFAGVARPQGGNYDIGAYEYSTLATPVNFHIVSQ